jgi:5-methylcytosine-specific restriction enzyme subunit McrC
MKGNIKVFEYQKIKVNEVFEDQKFEEKHFLALAKYQEREDSPYFKLGHKSVTFTQYVGAIQVGGLTIEVLPKADKPTGEEKEEEKNEWQRVLIGMLRAVHGFDIRITSDASLKLKANAILHFYFEIFVKEVEYLIHQGLVKRYRKEEGNQTSLKGSLQFGRHIQQNLVHQERFFVRYTTYDRNNPYNRVLLKTLKVIQHLNTSPALSSRIASLILNFPELPDVSVSEAFFEKLVINRKTENYKKALQISRLILLNYHPDLSKGRNDVLALMFDMNDLWEKYVLVCLRRAAIGNLIQVRGQASKNFWKSEKANTPMTVRPDIFIVSGTGTRMILDTKWKIPEKEKPNAGDLHQMFVYNHYWEATHSVLLYPQQVNDKIGHVGGQFYTSGKANKISETNQAHLVWVSVLKGKSLNKDLGTDLLTHFKLIPPKKNP